MDNNNKVEVKSFLQDASEKGLFAKESVEKGERVFSLEGFKTKVATRTSIQIGVAEHIDGIHEYFAFFNNSCQPNCAIDVTTLNVYALRDIEKGEELYFNYNSTEYDMASPFTCLCATPDCVREVKGYKYLSTEQRERIASYVSPALIELAGK